MKLQFILENSFDDWFNEPRPKVISTDKPITTPYNLKLYRGFDANLNQIHKKGDKFILSPTKSEQGLIWFTHNMINIYNPLEYARSRGAYLLTYKLNCVRHIERKIYDDGSYYDAIPQKILDITDPTSNSKFYMGIELPDGWIFSYKTEKFIGCSQELLVTRNMITNNARNL